MGLIYMYTSPSGKSYIGQTKKSIKERRENDYGKGYDTCPVFYKAIQKYGGLTNFTCRVLEYADNDRLNEREKYYIKKYNTLIPFGYNISSGGEKRPDVSKKVYKFNLKKDLIAEYKSITEAALENRCSIGSISEVCSGRKSTLLNCFWSFSKENNNFKKPKRKIVYQFDEQGNLIKEFESAVSADRYYNLTPKTVQHCANKNASRKRVNGTIFTYEPFIDWDYYTLKHSPTTISKESTLK